MFMHRFPSEKSEEIILSLTIYQHIKVLEYDNEGLKHDRTLLRQLEDDYHSVVKMI